MVVVIDMFYWGERRMLLDDDPADWRERPRSITAERIAAFNRRSSESEQLVGRTIFAAGFTWPGVMFWDDVRTVDYLLTPAGSGPAPDRLRGPVGGRPALLPPGRAGRAHQGGGRRRLDGLVPRAAQEQDPQHHRPHQAGAGAVPRPRLPRRRVAGHAGAAAGHQRQQGRAVRPGRRARELRQAGGLLREGGRPRAVRTRLYDTPHEFNAEMQTEAWAWLARHLAT